MGHLPEPEFHLKTRVEMKADVPEEPLILQLLPATSAVLREWRMSRAARLADALIQSGRVAPVRRDGHHHENQNNRDDDDERLEFHPFALPFPPTDTGL
jgi:hypothetical protein